MYRTHLSASKLPVLKLFTSIAAREMLYTASATGISFGSTARVSDVSD